MSGKSYDSPIPYETDLSLEERKKKFPDGTYVLNKKNQVCIMRNGRPYFADVKSNKKLSICSGKKTIQECPEKDCVFHLKSRQCRQRKDASAAVVEADKKLRDLVKKDPSIDIYKTNLSDSNSKIIRLLQELISNYSNESDTIYAQMCIKKLKKFVSNMHDDDIINLSFDSVKKSKFSASNYSNKSSYDDQFSD